ncbi:hypothetical protein DFH07DRAFT_832896 [Mycena maculata]|uniref:F-box domain-containing protein n=1 Tax=Mycena maculata TaxID=230809 RepID=A0AAD7ILT6_9AGAR|nr:hypothetical protein DFH07DRAFT_832896 [Mycena maculata]
MLSRLSTTFIRVRRRTGGFKRREKRPIPTPTPTPTPAPNPTPTLPVEMVEECLAHLDNADLLLSAEVCRHFNHYCGQLHLLRGGVDRKLLDTGHLDIKVALLPALQRALFLPPLTHLSCSFSEEDPYPWQELRRIEAIVKRSPDLLELNLTFGEALQSEVQENLDGEEPGVRVKSPEGLRQFSNALYDVFCSVSTRTSGPVVCAFPDVILRIPAAAVSQEFSPGYQTQTMALQDGYPNILHHPSGNHESALYLVPMMRSVSLRPLKDLSGRTACTLLIIDRDKIRSINLGPPRHPRSQPALSGVELTAILPHITLPVVTSVSINTSTIEPTVLGEFLLRLPGLKEIMVEEHESDTLPSPPLTLITVLARLPPVLSQFFRLRRLKEIIFERHGPHSDTLPCMPLALIIPPAHLPQVEIIGSRTSFHGLMALMDGVEPSKQYTMRFEFGRRRQIALQREFLQRIAKENTANHLDIEISFLSQEFEPEDIRIVASLGCVTSVTVSCTPLQDAAVFPRWLEALPALTHVRFVSWGGHEGDEEFMRKAGDTLPHITMYHEIRR